MVCIPCIVIPVFLYIWHRFLQPFVMKFWNPWKKPTTENEENKLVENAKTSDGLETKSSCPFNITAKTPEEPSSKVSANSIPDVVKKNS